MSDFFERLPMFEPGWMTLRRRLRPYTVTTVGTLKRKGSMWVKL